MGRHCWGQTIRGPEDEERSRNRMLNSKIANLNPKRPEAMCLACTKHHYGPCHDKTVPLSTRMRAGLIVDGGKARDYRAKALATSFVAEVMRLERTIDQASNAEVAGNISQSRPHQRPTAGDTYCSNCGLEDRFWGGLPVCPSQD